MAELITNEFTVNLPIDEAWPIICDVERIAPCLPGAQLQEIEGTTYRGVVKIKLGAITANFKGEAEFIERDDTAHRAKLAASGRDTGGRGNARADVTAEAESLSPTSTRCTVTAELNITGKVAQFGVGQGLKMEKMSVLRIKFRRGFKLGECLFGLAHLAEQNRVIFVGSR